MIAGNNSWKPFSLYAMTGLMERENGCDYFQGPVVMKGYFNNEVANANTFTKVNMFSLFLGRRNDCI